MAHAVRSYHQRAIDQANIASQADGILRTLSALGHDQHQMPTPIDRSPSDETERALIDAFNATIARLDPEAVELIGSMDDIRAAFSKPEFTYTIRNRNFTVANYHRTLSGNDIPKVAMPQTRIGEKF